MKLHEKITVYRKKYGLSQETLAEKIGVSRQAVSKWETGDALPEITKLKSLAECFDVTVDFLLDDSVDEYKLPDEQKPEGGTTTLDRFVVWIETFLDKYAPFLKKYSWVAGMLLILIGICIVIRGAIPLSTMLHIAVSMADAIALLYTILPLAYVGVGVLVIVCGIVVIKKTRKKGR